MEEDGCLFCSRRAGGEPRKKHLPWKKRWLWQKSSSVLAEKNRNVVTRWAASGMTPWVPLPGEKSRAWSSLLSLVFPLCPFLQVHKDLYTRAQRARPACHTSPYPSSLWPLAMDICIIYSFALALLLRSGYHFIVYINIVAPGLFWWLLGLFFKQGWCSARNATS